ncbi:MAG: spore protease YyaC [Thermoanaerobacteraceae bacterium]|nr:spore protease YyaC [Thermoanaerobacteraceae bacterium]
MSNFSPFNRLKGNDKKLPPKLKIDHRDPLATHKLSNHLSQYLLQLNPDNKRPVIVVAIGTDRSTGDSLGPLCGTKLEEFSIPNLSIYGTLDNPVHASNMDEKLRLIQSSHRNPLIIAVDACLGRADSVGFITLAPGSVRPGAGVNKTLPAVGDVHFTGIVNVGGYMEYFVLQNTRLSIVVKLANQIAHSILLGLKKAKMPIHSYSMQ